MTVKVAARPLKVTLVAPVKLVPVRITVVPTGPLVGVKLVRLGATVKLVALVLVPPALMTVKAPVLAPEGTVAVIWVGESTVKVAGVPLKLRLVAPVKLSPTIVTGVPTEPLLGLKLLMVGATVKLSRLDAVPPGVVTEIGPVVAPLGTVATTWVLEARVNVADRPLNRTAVVPIRLVPVKSTLVPTVPPVGLKPVIVGG